MDEFFRPRKLDLFTLLILPILMFGGLAYQVAKGYPIWILIVVIFPVVYMCVEGILLTRSFILVSDEKISCRIRRMKFELKWEEVVALSAISSQNPPKNISYIILGTPEKNWELRVDSFDGKQLWEAIKSKVSVEALAPDAYKKTGAYQKWEVAQNKLVDETLRFGTHWFYKLTAWGILALAFFLTFIAWEVAKVVGPSINIIILGGILGIIGCFILLWLSRSFVLVDSLAIKVSYALGKYSISWDEVDRIEITPDHSVVAFFSPTKRLVVLLEACGFSDRARFVEKVVQHAQQKSIEPKQVKSLSRTQLNTRLPKGESF